MAIPTPGSDETATPLYGIRKPKASRLAKFIWESIARIGDDVEAALTTFGLPTVVSSSSVVAFTDAGRDAHWGAPSTATARRTLQNLGAITQRPDKGWTEQYYAALTDGGANAGGAARAGWYPISGVMPFGSLKRNATPYTIANDSVTLATVLVTNLSLGVTPGSGAGSLTIVKDGLYEVSAGVMFQVNPTGSRNLFINRSSTSWSVNPLTSSSGAGASASNTTVSAKTIVPLVAGDVLRMFIYQTSGGTMSIEGTGGNADAPATYFYASYLGPAR